MKQTLKEIAEKYPDVTFNLIYDVWKEPGSTERTQVHVKGLSAKALAEKYGDFTYDGWYTTGVSPDSADVWATATDSRAYDKSLFEDAEIER